MPQGSKKTQADGSDQTQYGYCPIKQRPFKWAKSKAGKWFWEWLPKIDSGNSGAPTTTPEKSEGSKNRSSSYRDVLVAPANPGSGVSGGVGDGGATQPRGRRPGTPARGAGQPAAGSGRVLTPTPESRLRARIVFSQRAHQSAVALLGADSEDACLAQKQVDLLENQLKSMQSPDQRFDLAKSKFDSINSKIPAAKQVVKERDDLAAKAVTSLEESEQQLESLLQLSREASVELEDARKCLPSATGGAHGSVPAPLLGLDETVASVLQEVQGVDLGRAGFTHEESQALSGAVASLSVLQLALGRLRVGPTPSPPPFHTEASPEGGEVFVETADEELVDEDGFPPDWDERPELDEKSYPTLTAPGSAVGALSWKKKRRRRTRYPNSLQVQRRAARVASVLLMMWFLIRLIAPPGCCCPLNLSSHFGRSSRLFRILVSRVLCVWRLLVSFCAL